jgi:dsDNA-specific endonuclease/ATPase MutS2
MRPIVNRFSANVYGGEPTLMRTRQVSDNRVLRDVEQNLSKTQASCARQIAKLEQQIARCQEQKDAIQVSKAELKTKYQARIDDIKAKVRAR